ncbi:hypothetical protein GGC64_002059 [Mycobacterium sp. OAS707]|uniref:hypothetical protein n=1 Tax=unclassified Mycobacterium TaxID=2642494 RepID=UPI00178ACBC1|nr:hypothetical protein [Mycobacterium sp. OAS707]MBE1548051.1 hypothetical protein [Mycobacterium sp. OAS707]
MDTIWIGPVVLILFFGLAVYINRRRMSRWSRESQDYEYPARQTKPPRYLPNPRVPGSMANYLLAMTLPVAVALAVVGFWLGVTDLQRYSEGTPTRATVTYCGVGSRSNCEATWSIGGVSQTGVINGGFWDGADRVGSTLDVRVNNGEAYTAGSVPVGFAIGGGSAVVAISALVALIWRRVRSRRAVGAQGV